jgi:hypothetical protein
MLFRFIILTGLLNVLINSQSIALCNSISNSTSPADCLPYSSDDYFCCFLYAINSPAQFQVCNAIPKNRTITLKSVGNMQYVVNCTGIDNYNQYFPFEGKYSPCGVQDPDVPSDCFRYSTDTETCCLAGTDADFNNPLCYFYNNTIGNFTDNGFYFSCSSGFLKINILYFLIMLIITFI